MARLEAEHRGQKEAQVTTRPERGAGHHRGQKEVQVTTETRRRRSPPRPGGAGHHRGQKEAQVTPRGQKEA
ncbi:hypothetical protein NHX12_015325 [Muraenolepis orangiensis]|uniref:Uncharacterized protein n=1 Tax=Muraenolepis orangiensis TaxID=630683 RepID=A0A9Q0I4E9_9TELE|nr:hypothetical protein NHX12_015325 [Muraenolepis orangiensis]